MCEDGLWTNKGLDKNVRIRQECAGYYKPRRGNAGMPLW
jgi:hypothetical protein